MRFPETLSWRHALVRHASSYDFVREYAGANAGEGVTAQQGETGNKPPDYWCMSFVYRCVRRMLGKVLLRSASCSEQRAFAARVGALRTHAQFRAAIAANGVDAVLGWVMLIIDTHATPRDEEKAQSLAGHAHHTGLVGYYRVNDDTMLGASLDGSFITTEGNAADPTKPSSRDGNGVYGGRRRGSVNDSTTYEFIALEAL